jgi:hypothetical protein
MGPTFVHLAVSKGGGLALKNEEAFMKLTNTLRHLGNCLYENLSLSFWACVRLLVL